MTLNQICHYLDGIGIDRPLIDKTGVADTELFDIQLQFSIDDSTPGLHPRDTGDEAASANSAAFPLSVYGDTAAWIETCVRRRGRGSLWWLMEWRGLRGTSGAFARIFRERTNHDDCEIFVRNVGRGCTSARKSLVAIDAVCGCGWIAHIDVAKESGTREILGFG